jgi:hypothetical protein
MLVLLVTSNPKKKKKKMTFEVSNPRKHSVFPINPPKRLIQILLMTVLIELHGVFTPLLPGPAQIIICLVLKKTL